ncbi:MAG: 3-deoxy-D-manno-octulosonic acid transferase, partial [Gammaproteobacteria bacterium]
PSPPPPGGIWIHAVSVGEVQAIAPLVHLLLDEHSNLPITVTTTTPTGSEQVRRSFGDRVWHSYMPLDLPAFLDRFLGRVRPRHLLMVETEVWPNLLRVCRRHGVETLLANARLSERSLRGYCRFGAFARRVFGSIDRVAAQSVADAARFVQLGVRRERIEVTGSIKFDKSIPASVVEQVEVMRRNWSERPVWVAASTHEGEEEIMLAAHARLLKRLPRALLILVPRHPERFDRVATAIIRAGFEPVRRSAGRLPAAEDPVYLADTMGELPVLLGAAGAAFIGGSLARVGGHNMLEAAAQGVPVCFGPHTFNFAFIGQMLLDAGAARRVSDASELASVMADWLGDASARSEAGEAGRRIVERNRGALRRLYGMLEQRL